LFRRDDRPPSEQEQLWQLAALAVAERSEDGEFRFSEGFNTQLYNPKAEIDHLVHVTKRFPEEVRFFLAAGTRVEWQAPVSNGLAAQPAPVFRAGTDLVTVDVFVRDGAEPVPGLGPYDLIVLDHGARQQVGLRDVRDLCWRLSGALCSVGAVPVWSATTGA
jgi:hypothetical protein